ncbi:MAG: hypothetical protein ACOC6B_05500, partial [Thermodesulfobacteriota bacterium]
MSFFRYAPSDKMWVQCPEASGSCAIVLRSLGDRLILLHLNLEVPGKKLKFFAGITDKKRKFRA